MRLIELIEPKLHEHPVDIYMDVHEQLKGVPLTGLMVFCANTGLEVCGKSGRWVIPFFTAWKEVDADVGNRGSTKFNRSEA